MAKTTRSIGLNPNQATDILVLKWLDLQPNKSVYMKNLILQDIQTKQGFSIGRNNTLIPVWRGGVAR